MAVWRKIWQDSIATGKEMLLKNDQKGKIFEKLKQEYPGDAMVIFEEAIAFDCMKCYKQAIELYQKAFEELPVEHWKENARYLLNKAEKKVINIQIPKRTIADAEDATTEEAAISFKLDAYYYLHSYYYLPHNVRYLAISSMSRIDTESNMAIAIFRTCIEVSLKKAFEKEYNFTKEDKLSYIIKKLDTDNKIEDMSSYFFKVNDMAIEAIHDAKIFTPKEIAKAIVYFDSSMVYLNKLFAKIYKA